MEGPKAPMNQRFCRFSFYWVDSFSLCFFEITREKGFEEGFEEGFRCSGAFGPP